MIKQVVSGFCWQNYSPSGEESDLIPCSLRASGSYIGIAPTVLGVDETITVGSEDFQTRDIDHTNEIVNFEEVLQSEVRISLLHLNYKAKNKSRNPNKIRTTSEDQYEKMYFLSQNNNTAITLGVEVAKYNKIQLHDEFYLFAPKNLSKISLKKEDNIQKINSNNLGLRYDLSAEPEASLKSEFALVLRDLLKNDISLVYITDIISKNIQLDQYFNISNVKQILSDLGLPYAQFNARQENFADVNPKDVILVFSDNKFANITSKNSFSDFVHDQNSELLIVSQRIFGKISLKSFAQELAKVRRARPRPLPYDFFNKFPIKFKNKKNN